MGHRSRIRRAAKWGGVLVCGLILIAFVAGRVTWWSWRVPFPGSIRVYIRGSAMAVVRLPPPLPSVPPPTFAMEVQPTRVEVAAVEQFILELERPYWPNGWWVWPYWGVSIPLCLLFLVFVVPTALLFWRDRRRIPAGHCQHCGYNLTGNISGRCPECGQAVTSAVQEGG